MKYLKLTKTTKEINGITHYQIRATQDFWGISKGNLGGWIDKWSFDNSGEVFWVDTDSTVTYSTVTDSRVTRSTVTGSTVTDSTVTDSTVTYSTVTDSRVTDSRVTDSRVTDSRVTDSTVTYSTVTGSTVTGSTVTSSTVTYSTVTDSTEMLSFQGVGSSYSICLYKTEKGHLLNIGCWTGTVETLMEKVAERRKIWNVDEATKKRWVKEYESLLPLLQARVDLWESVKSEKSKTGLADLEGVE